MFIAAGLAYAIVCAQPHGHTLAGPRVRAERESIVVRSLEGHLIRPERTPEEAALSRLTLSESDRGAAVRVFLERTRHIDRFVAENLSIVREARRGASSPWRAAAIAAAVYSGTEPLRAGGCLWEKVRAALSPDAAPRFDAVMTEYWDSVAADSLGPSPSSLARFRVVSQERFVIFVREVERSYETLADSGSLAITAVTADLDLSEAQQARLREFADAFDDEGMYPPGDDQKKRLLAQVLSVLTESQRAEVLRRFKD